jgi:hypothetical protein
VGPFRDNAFYLLIWRAILCALSAVVLMATSGLGLGAALLVGAHIAVLFSLGVIVWAERLDDDRVARSGAWRMLAPGQRPAGIGGRLWARNCLKEVGLRFAKSASVAGIALSASAFLCGNE